MGVAFLKESTHTTPSHLSDLFPPTLLPLLGDVLDRYEALQSKDKDCPSPRFC